MTPAQGLAFLLALVIGLSLGALGSGGSIVTLPVLVYVAHINPKAAVGMSMAIVGATSLVAAFCIGDKAGSTTKPLCSWG